MPSVEKRFLLTKGPPWGFRLYLDNNAVLTVSKIRRHSPAEAGKLHSGDQIVQLNGRSTSGMSHADAVNVIDTTIGTLDILIIRFEAVSTKVLTMSDKVDSHELENIKTKMNLELKREEEYPELPKVPVSTPEIELNKSEEYDEKKEAILPIPISKLIQEYTESEEIYNYVPKKKHFADSAFYNDPQSLYPSIEERIDMAKRVALSLTAPDNKSSKGANIFERQRQRAEKYTLKKEESPPINANVTHTYDLEQWPQITEHKEKSPSPMYRLGYSTKQPMVPPPPPPPPVPNEAKTVQEFMDKVRNFPKTKHNEITPQTCFDIAAALHTSDSRGAQLFAQKKNRSKKWELTTPEPASSQQQVTSVAPWNEPKTKSSILRQSQPKPTVISVIRNNTKSVTIAQDNPDSYNSLAGQPRKPSLVIRRGSNQAPQESLTINNPVSMVTSKSFSHSQTTEVSQTSNTNQWKPVKFNIPQKA